MKYYCSVSTDHLLIEFDRLPPIVPGSEDDTSRLVTFGACRMIAKSLACVLRLSNQQSANLVSLLCIDFPSVWPDDDSHYLQSLASLKLEPADLDVIVRVYNALYSHEYRNIVHVANLTTGISRTLVFVG